MPSVNSNTSVLMRTSAARVVNRPTKRTSNSRQPQASSNPSAPPATLSSVLSVNNWRIRRPRLAPNAARTAISCSRRMIRASARLATLAHAINSTSPAVASSTSNMGRTCLVN